MAILKKSDIMVKEADLRGPFFKQLFRRMSMPIARFLAKYTSVSPNEVTLSIFILVFLNAYFFYLGTYFYLVIAGLLLLVRFLFDYVDGSLARIKGIGSNFGYWLDHNSDEYAKAILFFGIMMGVYNQTQDHKALIFGFLAFSGYILGSLTYQIFMRTFTFANDVVESEKGKRKFIRNFFYVDPFVTIVMLIAAFTNQMYWFLAVSAGYAWLFSFGQFIKMSISVFKHRKSN